MRTATSCLLVVEKGTTHSDLRLAASIDGWLYELNQWIFTREMIISYSGFIQGQLFLDC